MSTLLKPHAAPIKTRQRLLMPADDDESRETLDLKTPLLRPRGQVKLSDVMTRAIFPHPAPSWRPTMLTLPSPLSPPCQAARHPPRLTLPPAPQDLLALPVHTPSYALAMTQLKRVGVAPNPHDTIKISLGGGQPLEMVTSAWMLRRAFAAPPVGDTRLATLHDAPVKPTAATAFLQLFLMSNVGMPSVAILSQVYALAVRLRHAILLRVCANALEKMDAEQRWEAMDANKDNHCKEFLLAVGAAFANDAQPTKFWAWLADGAKRLNMYEFCTLATHPMLIEGHQDEFFAHVVLNDDFTEFEAVIAPIVYARATTPPVVTTARNEVPIELAPVDTPRAILEALQDACAEPDKDVDVILRLVPSLHTPQQEGLMYRAVRYLLHRNAAFVHDSLNAAPPLADGTLAIVDLPVQNTEAARRILDYLHFKKLDLEGIEPAELVSQAGFFTDDCKRGTNSAQNATLQEIIDTCSPKLSVSCEQLEQFLEQDAEHYHPRVVHAYINNLPPLAAGAWLADVLGSDRLSVAARKTILSTPHLHLLPVLTLDILIGWAQRQGVATEQVASYLQELGLLEFVHFELFESLEQAIDLGYLPSDKVPAVIARTHTARLPEVFTTHIQFELTQWRNIKSLTFCLPTVSDTESYTLDDGYIVIETKRHKMEIWKRHKDEQRKISYGETTVKSERVRHEALSEQVNRYTFEFSTYRRRPGFRLRRPPNSVATVTLREHK